MSGIQSMVNVWERMTATVEQFGVLMLTGKQKNFLSGAADNTIRLWDVENGIMLNRIDTKSAVRTCKFSFSGNMVAFTTDKNMGQPCVIHIVDTRIFGSDQPMITIPIPAKGPKLLH